MKNMTSNEISIDDITSSKMKTKDITSAKNIAAVRKYWKAHKNIWEISQLTGVSEQIVTELTRRNGFAHGK